MDGHLQRLVERRHHGALPRPGSGRQECVAPGLAVAERRDVSAESPLTGQATLSPADAQAFLAGNLYVNVHTKDHPAGEIRGQVVPPK
nr:CHRD domain-containing protein [Burkholderia ubonensis]